MNTVKNKIEEVGIDVFKQRLQQSAQRMMQYTDTIGVLNCYGREHMCPTSLFGSVQDQVDNLARELFSIEKMLRDDDE